MVDRVTPIDDVIRSNPKAWNYKGLTFEVTDFAKFLSKNQEIVDLRVKNQTTGFKWYDDRFRLVNPALQTRGTGGVLQLNPKAALNETLYRSVYNNTKKLIVPNLKRITGDIFAGDSVSIRADAEDGRINAFNAVYASAQAGAAASANNTSTAVAINTSTGYSITQYFTLFDTSVINDLATILSTVFTLFANGTANTNTNTVTAQVRVKDWGGTLTAADWINVFTSTNWTNLPYFARLAVASYTSTDHTANAFTEEVGAIANINLTGFTQLVVGIDRMYGAAPTGANAISFYTANASGTVDDPLLDVTFSVPVGANMPPRPLMLHSNHRR